jgi:hypothetical protein
MDRNATGVERLTSAREIRDNRQKNTDKNRSTKETLGTHSELRG